jgi:hypothetical protein
VYGPPAPRKKPVYGPPAPKPKKKAVYGPPAPKKKPVYGPPAPKPKRIYSPRSLDTPATEKATERYKQSPAYIKALQDARVSKVAPSPDSCFTAGATYGRAARART